MKILILGANGMLGRVFGLEARGQGCDVVTFDLADADYTFDIKNDERLTAMLSAEEPDVVVNTVAIIDHNFCEKNPQEAYLVNTRPIATILDSIKNFNSRLVHVSTDHYFVGGKDRCHSEDEHVILLSEYARTKFLAETLALQESTSLVARTNIVGFKFSCERPTFVEWALRNLARPETPMPVFTDYYTSSIDVWSFSELLLSLIEKKAYGLLNVAAHAPVSKKDFIIHLANAFKLSTGHLVDTSVHVALTVKRAESLGLDVSRVENLLGKRLPGVSEVISRLKSEYDRFDDVCKRDFYCQ